MNSKLLKSCKNFIEMFELSFLPCLICGCVRGQIMPSDMSGSNNSFRTQFLAISLFFTVLALILDRISAKRQSVPRGLHSSSLWSKKKKKKKRERERDSLFQ